VGLKEKRKKKKGKRGYAVISLVTSILTILGGITGAMAWWIDKAESERQIFQYESKQLGSSIQYAQELLPTCDMMTEDKVRINTQLQKAKNTLELKNDLDASRMIYDSVVDELINCPGFGTIPSIGFQGNLLGEPWILLSTVLAVPASISVIYGIKWYRSRKEVDLSDESTSTYQKP
jgi:hypothetical protein